MRIVKVHNQYTDFGGEDTVFQSEVELLRSRGHEVIEYIEYNNKIASMDKAAVAFQTLWSNSSYQKIIRFLRGIGPQVVHFHNTFPLISPSAYYACQKLNIPVVQTLDNQRLICPASTFYRDGKLCLDCLGKTPPWPAVLHACYHNSRLHSGVVASMLTLHRSLGTWQTKVDRYLCSTNFYRDLFVQAGFPPAKLIVVPHFINKRSMPRPSDAKADYALFVGRLDPEKGVKTLLDAWRILKFPLKIRGNGRLDDWARDYIKQNKIDNIEFVGRMEKEKLSELIENSRFLILPSEGYYETFGLVIIEAYARGIPVIVSNIGVMPELVSDKKTGLLFEPGNAGDLADKANWMWNHSIESHEMGVNGYNAYLDRFTEEQCYQTLIQVYESLIKSR